MTHRYEPCMPSESLKHIWIWIVVANLQQDITATKCKRESDYNKAHKIMRIWIRIGLYSLRVTY